VASLESAFITHNACLLSRQIQYVVYRRADMVDGNATERAWATFSVLHNNGHTCCCYKSLDLLTFLDIGQL
jgi:hypothetical protein